MRIRLLGSIAVHIAIVATIPHAQAAMPHSLGRHCGLGWGDGYHAPAACPPTRHRLFHQQSAAPSGIPWWMIPASRSERPAESEVLPPPAINAGSAGRAFPPSGASLFRQPGDGTQATLMTAAAPAASSR
jgi:hypothetical protein